MAKRAVYAFDFDGTLTLRDSFFALIRHAKGLPALCAGLARLALPLTGAVLHLTDRGLVKERLFAHFFGGMDAADFDRCCERFAKENGGILRSGAMDAVRDACARGTAVIVSASAENWVRPFFAGLAVEVIATRLETAGGRLTGRFLGANCTGAEKVRRLAARFPDRASYTLTAYGDSAGDRELLAFADEAHFRPFRT